MSIYHQVALHQRWALDFLHPLIVIFLTLSKHTNIVMHESVYLSGLRILWVFFFSNFFVWPFFSSPHNLTFNICSMVSDTSSASIHSQFFVQVLARKDPCLALRPAHLTWITCDVAADSVCFRFKISISQTLTAFFLLLLLLLWKQSVQIINAQRNNIFQTDDIPNDKKQTRHKQSKLSRRELLFLRNRMFLPVSSLPVILTFSSSFVSHSIRFLQAFILRW